MTDRQFSIIQFKALNDDRLEHSHIATLAVIGGHTSQVGQCKIKQGTIAKYLRVSRGTANKYIKHLTACGYLRNVRTQRADGGNGANKYFMLYDEPDEDTPPVSPRVNRVCTPQGEQGMYRLDDTSINGGLFNGDTLTDKNNKKDPDKVFEKLWKLVYEITPKSKKQYHNKQTSRKRFKKLSAGKVSASRVANAVLWFYDTDEQKRDDRKFMFSLKRVLNEPDLIEPFYSADPIADRPTPLGWDDLWKQRAAQYESSGWSFTWGLAQDVPLEYRKYFSKEAQEKLGWS